MFVIFLFTNISLFWSEFLKIPFSKWFVLREMEFIVKKIRRDQGPPPSHLIFMRI